MEMTSDLILKITGVVGLIAISFFATSTLSKIKLDQLGDDNESKRKIAMKLVANVFIFLSITVIIFAGIFKIFHEQVILLLFVSSLAALGVKLVVDLKRSE